MEFEVPLLSAPPEFRQDHPVVCRYSCFSDSEVSTVCALNVSPTDHNGPPVYKHPTCPEPLPSVLPPWDEVQRLIHYMIVSDGGHQFLLGTIPGLKQSSVEVSEQQHLHPTPPGLTLGLDLPDAPSFGRWGAHMPCQGTITPTPM